MRNLLSISVLFFAFLLIGGCTESSFFEGDELVERAAPSRGVKNVVVPCQTDFLLPFNEYNVPGTPITIINTSTSEVVGSFEVNQYHFAEFSITLETDQSYMWIVPNGGPLHYCSCDNNSGVLFHSAPTFTTSSNGTPYDTCIF